MPVGNNFRVPDLLILKSRSFGSLVGVVASLLSSGTYQFEFTLLDNEA